MADRVEWVLNGKRVQNEAGMTILEAARTHGVEIPAFCYHPGLTIAGNCRICLVETNRSPKPAISCSERIAPDLEVQTHSPMAVEAREGVMEFQLINHPLDCPVCDKAGECVLQDYSYDHGPDRSRFNDPKNLRHTKRLGPTIEIWGNRCIVCTRCVRFCDEISGTSELCVIDRGDRAVVDVFPGIPIDNPLAGNTIDVCPVGALIGNDFMFEARVWYMDHTASVCAGCARGCNIDVQSLDGYLKRLIPRENPEVNEWWMCDFGRYGWRYVHADDRVVECLAGGAAIPATEAIDACVELIDRAREKGQRVGFLVDPFLTCEELHLVSILAGGFENAPVAGWLPPAGEAHRFPKGFKISAEKAPNRRGVEAILGSETFGKKAKALLGELNAGNIDLLILFAGFPNGDPPDEWHAAVAQASHRVAVTSFDGAWSQGADVVLPSGTPFEKEGTYVNEDGRVQRVRSAAQPWTALPGTESVQGAAHRALRAETELHLLQEILCRLGVRERRLTSAGVFRDLARARSPFEGMTHSDLPAHGAPLGSARETAATGGSS